MYRVIPPAFLYLILAIFSISCSDHGGIGHEGEAKITGQLVFQDGVPAPETNVELYPQTYDPVKDIEKIPLEKTDKQGVFTLSNIKPGKYSRLRSSSKEWAKYRIKTVSQKNRLASNIIQF